VICGVHGGFAAENSGAGFVKYLVTALRARTLIRTLNVKRKNYSLDEK